MSQVSVVSHCVTSVYCVTCVGQVSVVSHVTSVCCVTCVGQASVVSHVWDKCLLCPMCVTSVCGVTSQPFSALHSQRENQAG